MNLYLIGFRGTGAPAVGKRLAARAGFTFVDMHELIVKALDEGGAAGRPGGDGAAVDAVAEEVFCRVAALNGCVVAAEGTELLRTGAARAIRERGVTLWLKASGRTIVDRVEKQLAQSREEGYEVPFRLSAGDIETSLLKLAPLYEEAADFSLETDGLDIDGIVEAAWELLWGDSKHGW